LSHDFSASHPPELVAITAGDHRRSRDLTQWLQPLGAAGLPALLLREPHLEAQEVATLAHAALEFIETVIVHVRCAGAIALCQQHPRLGLHLSASYDSTKVPGSLWPRTSVSCHHEDELITAFSSGARFALLSPIYKPLSKPNDEREPLGLGRFLELSANRPVLALGGITPKRHYSLLAAGGRGSAICGALFAASSPSDAIVVLSSFLEKAQP